MKLSRYFDSNEVSCKGSKCCGGAYPMDARFLELLDKVRAETCQLNITSGFRCLTHNARIGGAVNSNHTRGIACDCVPKDGNLQKLETVAKKYFSEVILYIDRGFVHIGKPKN